MDVLTVEGLFTVVAEDGEGGVYVYSGPAKCEVTRDEGSFWRPPRLDLAYSIGAKTRYSDAKDGTAVQLALAVLHGDEDAAKILADKVLLGD